MTRTLSLLSILAGTLTNIFIPLATAYVVAMSCAIQPGGCHGTTVALMGQFLTSAQVSCAGVPMLVGAALIWAGLRHRKHLNRQVVARADSAGTGSGFRR